MTSRNKRVNNPSERHIPVNISLKISLIDRIDELCGGIGKRSAFIESLLEEILDSKYPF